MAAHPPPTVGSSGDSIQNSHPPRGQCCLLLQQLNQGDNNRGLGDQQASHPPDDVKLGQLFFGGIRDFNPPSQVRAPSHRGYRFVPAPSRRASISPRKGMRLPDRPDVQEWPRGRKMILSDQTSWPGYWWIPLPGSLISEKKSRASPLFQSCWPTAASAAKGGNQSCYFVN